MPAGRQGWLSDQRELYPAEPGEPRQADSAQGGQLSALTRSAEMETYNFSLVITRPSVDEETAADRLYGGGCDDALFSVSGGVYEVEFDREARSLRAAVRSAISDVNKAGVGARVVRVLPDDLVNANAIAERAGKTRQAVRFWYLGERGAGFPAPRAIVGKSPVWSWVEVARWLQGRGELDLGAVEAARVIARINREIEAAPEPPPAQGHALAAAGRRR